MKQVLKLFLIFLVCLSLFLFSQEMSRQPSPSAVGVPVRVFGEDKFIDSLVMDDFELAEDGVPQKVEALYLIRKNRIERKEGEGEFTALLSRNFYLLFQMVDYEPRIKDSIDFLFNRLLLPGDSLTIMTPMKPYTLSPEAFQLKPKESICREMQGILRKDIQMGSSDYRNALRDLRRLVKAISGDRSQFDPEMETDATLDSLGVDFLLPRYKTALQKMENMRYVDERKIISFAQALKEKDGPKIVFLFYQREFRPEINPAILSYMMSNYQDQPHVINDLSDLFHLYKRDITLDAARIKQFFADSSVCFHFLFMDKEAKYVSGIQMREQSEDLYPVFTELAESTGGVAKTSQNLSFAFQNAAESSESYYLLYYTSSLSGQGGSFRRIHVRLKKDGYRLGYRQGYFFD